MSHFKDKLQVFIMGLMLGLLVGGGFFILKLDDYFKELNFYKHLSETQAEKAEEKEEVKTTEKSKQSYYKSTSSYKLSASSSSVDSVKQSEADLKTTVDSSAVKDTLRIASSEENTNVNMGIVVRKDELIATKQVDLENLSANNANNKDSLLQKVSGIRDDKNIAKQPMNVEFWRSPINYKGYKMAKNKVVLFGIAEQDDIKLYHLEEGTFIKLQQGVYKLDYTNDFRQLERINDESVLARLK